MPDACFSGEVCVGLPENIEGEANLDFIGELKSDGRINGDGTNDCVGDCKIGVL